MKDQSKNKYKSIAAALIFTVYLALTILAIWFNLERKNLNYSAVFAVLAIIFEVVFKFVVPNRQVTLYKRADGAVKCLKCNKVSANGKIYCKKHLILSRVFFVIKLLILNAILTITFDFIKNYSQKIYNYVTPDDIFLHSAIIGLIATALYAPFYMYIRLGGRESTDSTVLDVKYIEVSTQKEKKVQENHSVAKTNDELPSIEKPKHSGIFPWDEDEEDEEDEEDDEYEDTAKEHTSGRGLKAAVAVIAVLLIGSICFNIFIFQRNNSLNQQLSEANVEISKNQKEIKDLKWDAEYEKKRAEEEAAKRRRERADRALNSSFLYKHAACINEGFIYYHHSDCEYFDTSSFYIHNTEWAEAAGYKPCPYCWEE